MKTLRHVLDEWALDAARGWYINYSDMNKLEVAIEQWIAEGVQEYAKQKDASVEDILRRIFVN